MGSLPRQAQALDAGISTKCAPGESVLFLWWLFSGIILDEVRSMGFLLHCIVIKDYVMLLKKPVVFETTFTSYTGTEIIGEGGAGCIYRAVDDAGNVCAIKLLHAEKVKGEKAKRFKNEVLFCSKKHQHQNIVTVIEHGVFTEGKRLSPFYVMPLYSSSLKELIATGIPREKVLFYFGQLLDGGEAAHLQQVTHRDLKPENVLYDEKQDRLLLADFGIAHFEEEALYTSVETLPNARLANFQYAAPEQRSRGAPVDHRADIYSLGLILNEMFTGLVPHGTGYKTIGSVAPDYDYLDDLVLVMLRQSAEERPASIEVIKRELIGRKHEFIMRQRISELKQTVVPMTDSDDPLIVDPPHLIDVDVEPGVLILLYQRPVTAKWIQAWQQIGRTSSISYIGNTGPEHYSFSDNRATIRVRSAVYSTS